MKPREDAVVDYIVEWALPNDIEIDGFKLPRTIYNKIIMERDSQWTPVIRQAQEQAKYFQEQVQALQAQMFRLKTFGAVWGAEAVQPQGRAKRVFKLSE